MLQLEVNQDRSVGLPKYVREKIYCEEYQKYLKDHFSINTLSGNDRYVTIETVTDDEMKIHDEVIDIEEWKELAERVDKMIAFFSDRNGSISDCYLSDPVWGNLAEIVHNVIKSGICGEYWIVLKAIAQQIKSMLYSKQSRLADCPCGYFPENIYINRISTEDCYPYTDSLDEESLGSDIIEGTCSCRELAEEILQRIKALQHPLYALGVYISSQSKIVLCPERINAQRCGEELIDAVLAHEFFHAAQYYLYWLSGKIIRHGKNRDTKTKMSAQFETFAEYFMNSYTDHNIQQRYNEVAIFNAKQRDEGTFPGWGYHGASILLDAGNKGNLSSDELFIKSFHRAMQNWRAGYSCIENLSYLYEAD